MCSVIYQFFYEMLPSRFYVKCSWVLLISNMSRSFWGLSVHLSENRPVRIIWWKDHSLVTFICCGMQIIIQKSFCPKITSRWTETVPAEHQRCWELVFKLQLPAKLVLMLNNLFFPQFVICVFGCFLLQGNPFHEIWQLSLSSKGLKQGCTVVNFLPSHAW